MQLVYTMVSFCHPRKRMTRIVLTIQISLPKNPTIAVLLLTAKSGRKKICIRPIFIAALNLIKREYNL